MFTESLWKDFSEMHDYPTLQGDIEVDVAIVGGGITGITTAHLLSELGMEVAVLESLKVGGGTTSHSTGNLYFTIDQILSKLKTKYDDQVIREVVRSRSAALDRIEEFIQRYRLDCDFHRRPWHLYSADEQHANKIEKEIEVAREAGVTMETAAPSEFGLKVERGVKVPRQAQLNPMRYVQELAQAVASDTCRIYENTRVTDVSEEGDNEVLVQTTRGRVRAKYAVHATHTPKGIKTVQTVLGPYREYGIACEAGDLEYPPGIFWGYHANGKKYSTRIYERDNKRFVIVVGEPHKVGQAENNRERINQLVNFAREHLGLTKVVYRWGGQHYRPADLLPYIGRDGSSSNVFIATGFSTDGLVYGTLSAMLIRDAIAGKENKWAALYDYTRFHPRKSAKKFLEENLNVAKEFLKDWTSKGEDTALDDINPGEGRIISRDGQPVGAYRDTTGKVSMVSAVCTHLKCIVHWNNAEKTWDCPCHGTRFEPDGTVIEGPAYNPLEKVDGT